MKKIAIVDDEPDIATVLKTGLEHHGFTDDVYNGRRLRF